jgi:large subunit ribosomal protein L1
VDDLAENYDALMATLVRMKPSSSKGNYVKGVALSTTMGVGIKVEYNV